VSVRAFARGRAVAGYQALTGDDDQQRIAHAAWSIIAATGGLVDRAQIRERLGLSRGRVHQLTGQRHFPRPVYGEGTARPLWLAIDVDRYRAEPPPVGRPPKDSDERA
jgi:predicted DNA-binding transcriptional regulator AlpA